MLHETHQRDYRGRFAPSPTGLTHLGHARTALFAWLRARVQGGEVVMRMEDIDRPRVRQGAEEAIYRDMKWLGLDWDEGPDVGGACGPYRQSERDALYVEALQRLRQADRLFECSCSRKDLQEASAPHGPGPRRYPGTCYEGPSRSDRPTAQRFRMRHPGPGFEDAIAGRIESGLVTDDFIVRRSDALFAYQLAVTVDDAAMGITEVVRGDDLLLSTPLQLALFQALGLQAPTYAHLPLVLGSDGARLSKRHAATSIAEYRDAGWTAERVIAMIATSFGLRNVGAAISTQDLIPIFEEAEVKPGPWVAPEPFS